MVSMAMNNVSVFEELNQLRQEFHRLDLRVTAIESKPEEKLVKELEEKVGGVSFSFGRNGFVVAGFISQLSLLPGYGVREFP